MARLKERGVKKIKKLAVVFKGKHVTVKGIIYLALYPTSNILVYSMDKHDLQK
jgi:hypothetical protein